MEIRKLLQILSFAALGGFIISSQSCKKEVLVSIQELPVVEAYLYPGKPVQVRVSYQKGLTDTAAYGMPITGLSISLSDGTETRILQETKSGSYTTVEPDFIKSTGNYSLKFIFNGSEVSAETTMPGKPAAISSSATELVVPEFSFGGAPPEFETVRLHWNNPEGKNHIVYMKYMEPSRLLINSFFSQDTTTSIEINAAKASFLDVQQMNFRYLGNYRVILARVNQEYIEMLNNNGTSSQNLTNPPTNIKNGLGIFTALHTDTLTHPFLVRRE